MQFVGLLILFILACLIAFSVQGCRNSKPGGGSSSGSSTSGQQESYVSTGVRPDLPLTVRQADSMSRAQIEQMLRNLQMQKAPQPISGAMCYSVASTPEQVEYLCPACGQKTLYTQGDMLARFVNWELGSCRREFEQLANSGGLKMALDESSFCAKCTPNAGKHELVLKITYPDGSIHSSRGIQLTDLKMLRYFLGGSLAFKGNHDEILPLQDCQSRLRELLGVENSAVKKK
jgi:hypothetical protein